MLKNFDKSILLALGLCAITAPSFAVPYGTNNVYKYTQNGRIYVNIHGPAAGATADVSIDGVSRTRVATADACGQIAVSNSSTAPLSGTVQIGTQSINYATLPTQLKPSCINGTLSEARTTHYKTPEGTLVGVGFTPSNPQNVITTGPRTRRITANSCGARFTGTTTAPISDTTSFTYNGTSYTVGTLPDAVVGPRSLTVNGAAVCFKPTGTGSW